jgi:hypothetical protein
MDEASIEGSRQSLEASGYSSSFVNTANGALMQPKLLQPRRFMSIHQKAVNGHFRIQKSTKEIPLQEADFPRTPPIIGQVFDFNTKPYDAFPEDFGRKYEPQATVEAGDISSLLDGLDAHLLVASRGLRVLSTAKRKQKDVVIYRAWHDDDSDCDQSEFTDCSSVGSTESLYPGRYLPAPMPRKSSTGNELHVPTQIFVGALDELEKKLIEEANKGHGLNEVAESFKSESIAHDSIKPMKQSHPEPVATENEEGYKSPKIMKQLDRLTLSRAIQASFEQTAHLVRTKKAPPRSESSRAA